MAKAKVVKKAAPKKSVVKKSVAKVAAPKAAAVVPVAPVVPKKVPQLRVTAEGVVLNKRIETTREGVVIRVLED